MSAPRPPPIDLTSPVWTQPIVDGCARYSVEVRDGGMLVVGSIATARGDTMVTALPLMSREAAWQLAQRLSLMLLATEDEPPGTVRGRG